MEGNSSSWTEAAILLPIFVIGCAGFFVWIRRSWSSWFAGVCSVAYSSIATVLIAIALGSVTGDDVWGPRPRARSSGRPISEVDIRTSAWWTPVSIGDWNGDAVPEQLRSRWLTAPHFPGKVSHWRIEVLSGRDEQVIGTLDFRDSFAAVPSACGDLDGDGVEEFAVDYHGETLVWGRECFGEGAQPIETRSAK